MEGFEYDVLLGSKRKMSEIQYILIENQFGKHYKKNYEIVKKFLFKNNYKILKNFFHPLYIIKILSLKKNFVNKSKKY